MIVISIMWRVIFSEYYFKDHIGNKCTLVCFNVSSLVRLHACSLLVCSCFFVILLNKFISYHIISYHIISYHIISYHIISYHIISYHIISYYWPEWQLFNVAGYLIEERRRWPIIIACPRGQWSK